MPHTTATAGPVRLTIIVGALATAAFAAWMLFDPAGDVTSRWLSDFTLVLVPAGSAAALFTAAHRSEDKTRQAWWWLGFSSLTWAAGQLVWALQQNVFSNTLPIGSFPDVFWMVASLAGIYGVAALATGGTLSKVRVSIDGAIAGLALLAVSWVIVVDPALDSGSLGSLGTVTALSYKVFDIIEVALLLSVMAGFARRGRTPLIWLTVAATLQAGTNTAYTAAAVKGSYQTGDVLDVGWMAAFVALYIAGRAAQVESTTWRRYVVPQRRALVPYVPVVVGALAILWTSQTDSTVPAGVLEIAAVIGVLMVPRQWLALSEHASSHRRLAEAQHVGGVGSWEVDLRSGRISWSDQMFRIFDLDPASGDPDRETIDAIFHADDVDRVWAEAERIAEEGGTFVLDHRICHSDGSVRWVRATGRAVGGRRPCLQGTSQDITEEKSAEFALRQSQKLEALGRLAGGIAHDFNNLLTPIIAHAQLLGMSIGEDSPDAGSVAAICTAGRRAADLTQQLLAFCRAQDPAREPVDVNSVADDVALLLASSLPGGVTLDVEPSADDAFVVADVGQLNQVLLNLALNAIDAMTDGGTLRITTRVEVPVPTTNLVVGSIPAGECVRITVTDDGTGMDEATLARCFEPFFTTKSSGKGTGLGLPSVYGIVTQAGGAIEIVTGPGSGTAVSVLLGRATADPGDANEQAPATVPAPVRAAPPRSRIMLVDDDKAIVDVVTRMLESAGHEVIGFVDSRHALAEAGTLPSIDLLLTDVVMPHVGGIDLAALARIRQPDIPVLFMSGYDEGGDAVRAAATAGGQVLAKPFLSSQLTEAVSAALTRA